MSFFSFFKKKSTNTGGSSQNIPANLETASNIENVESSSIGSQTVESALIYEEVTSALETSQVVETTPEKSVFEKYLLQFQYDPETELAFIYQEGETELFQSVLLIAKYALRHIRIPSLFAEDSDFVYFTVFDCEQYDYIGLMDYALRYCKVHSYLTFYEEPAKNIARDLKQYGLKILGARPDRPAYIQIRNHANVTDSSFLECMGEKLLQLLDDIDMHINTYRTAHCIGNLDLYKETLRSILKSLDIDQSLYVRWKREYEMYSLVKIYYPDVVFQYHSQWLERQSLDAYVPSIKVGFEYQGQQHYESVEFFGGPEALEHRMENDALKKKKCKQNGVVLVEWIYTEQINSAILRDKLSKVHFVLPEKPSDLFRKNDIENAAIDSAAINLDRNQDPKELFHKALELRNREAIYASFQKLVRKSPKTVTKYWERLITQYADERLAPDSVSDNNDPYGADLLHIIARSKILTEYYLCRSDVRNNYYTRKVIIYLIKDGCDSDTVASYLDRMRKQVIKNGGTRGEFNNRIKCLYGEAADYGIDNPNIQEILLKIGINHTK